MQDKYPKILLLAGWYPNSLYPAEGDFIRYQARLMKRQGLDISVFHSNLSIRYLRKGLWRKRLTISNNGVDEFILERPFIPRNTAFSMRLWANIVKRDAEEYLKGEKQPDLIHAHTYLGGYIASLLKKSLDLPYIMTLHETSFLTNQIPGYHLEIVNQSLDLATKVVSVGSKLAMTIQNKFDIPSIVIPNFIDFQRFKPSSEKHEKYSFIFVGDLVLRKNVKALIKAFVKVKDELSNVELIIVGDGPESGKLRNWVRGFGNNRGIIFKGRQTQEEVAKELSMSHCFILPSSSETFGIVLVEALSSGIPVISTSSGGPSDIISSEVGIILDSEEPKALSEAMIRIHKNRGHYEPSELAEYARLKFSAEVVIRKYVNLYSDVLGV